jgi:hypothetical protein
MVRPVLYSALTIDYPSAHGLPMAESDFQRESLIYAIEALRVYFQARDDVYVSGKPVPLLRSGQPAGGGGAGRVCRAGGGQARSAVVPAVAGAQGVGCRAGNYLAQHPQCRPGNQTRAVRLSRCSGVLAVRSHRGLPDARAARLGLARGSLEIIRI